MEEKYQSNMPSTNYFKDLIKTVAFSLIITFLILLASALLLCFTDFPEKYTLPSAIAATILGVFAGSSMAARKNPESRLVSSLLTAFIYSVIAYIIGCILGGKIRFTTNTALFLAIALITGAIASILAAREKRPKKFGTGSSTLDRFKKKRFPKSYSLGKSSR
ncbi:MAG: TIGR04086 family membrane protein [Clostridiaceae bacterium]|nr:TIGR04086 family membrane protein [Clostridiaceae bacterium]